MKRICRKMLSYPASKACILQKEMNNRLNVFVSLRETFNQMKSILFLLLIFLVGCSGFEKKADDTKQVKEPDFAIVLTKNADSTYLITADQLKKYWKEITGRNLEVLNKAPSYITGIYLGYNFAGSPLIDSLNTLKEDGFIISIKKDSIFLTGKNPKATLYAVNTFLEEYLGCIKLSDTEDFIPKMENIQFESSFKIYNPAFDFRRALFPAQKNESYRQWYKLESLDDWGMFVHTFHRLMPPEEYFAEHPEYYSLINGRRLQDAQLCLSNPNVIDKLIENLGEEIAKKPEKTYWSVSQNDAINFCECENCEKLYDKYGSISGVYIEMANTIARAFPEKQISTLAYQFTRSAPKNITPDVNVNIMFCSIECNRGMPLTDDDRSEAFVKDMKNWSRLTNNIFVWDYVVQFKNYLCPFPNFPVLQPNIQFFKDNNIEMMFEQGSGGNWSDLVELKQYLVAKLLWDTDVNVDSLATRFINAYYGGGGPYIKKYYESINKEMKEHSGDQFLNIYGFPSDYTKSFLSPDLMLYYKSLMDEAEKAVGHDSLLLDRIKRTRLSVDFAFVDISINNYFEEMPAIIDGENGKEINPLIIRLLQNMVNCAKTRDNIKINERGFKLLDYKKYAFDKLNSMLKSNKLKKANIKISTTYSDKYPVGGERALNDNLFGSLDFHHNWLGFEGEDMLVDIDLLEPTEISEINMNFLKAVNSWVFLPTTIQIAISKDGLNYETIKTIHPENNDRGYLVKSIPFSLEINMVNTRYLRISAISLKSCPDWHRGYGKPSWIFIDEIIVN